LGGSENDHAEKRLLLSRGFLLHAVVRGFAGDDDVVDVALA
jgi:hypothetical protein